MRELISSYAVQKKSVRNQMAVNDSFRIASASENGNRLRSTSMFIFVHIQCEKK